jgi:hypothetical protein
VKRLLALACALALQAAPALAGDDYYQEPSSSRDYGFVGYGPPGRYYWGGWINQGPPYGYVHGTRDPGYSYREAAPAYGYRYGNGYSYESYARPAYDGYRYVRGRHRCGCRYSYYDDDYR